MRVTILCVGNVKGPLGTLIRDYEDRASRYWRLRVRVVDGGAGRSRKTDPEAVKQAEEARLLPELPESGVTVALTREGKGMSSRELADFLEEQALRSVPDVTFVIGGALGLGGRVLDRSSFRFSLSELTLPHELTRLILTEQLYRAGTIRRNEPYHKGP